MEIGATVERQRERKRDVMSAENDAVLARQIAGGDTDAWDRFFARYAPWVYRFAYRHLAGNAADAEDVCSEIMLTAAAGIAGFDARRGDLDGWMCGIARHGLSRWCRRRHVELPLLPALTESTSAPETISCCFPDSIAVRDLVNRALASLPERQATALVGKYIEGCTTDELARRMQSSAKAVESLLVRARTAFRASFSTLAECNTGGESGE